jgi:hypothetical protein
MVDEGLPRYDYTSGVGGSMTGYPLQFLCSIDKMFDMGIAIIAVT